MWNPGSISPTPDFVAALYDEDNSDGEDVSLDGESGDESQIEYSSDEIDPVYCDSASPTPLLYPPFTRPTSPELHGVIVYYDEDGTPFGEIGLPDSHALYESVERLRAERSVEGESSVGERGNSRGRSLRGRAQGRGGRVRNRGQDRGRGGRRCRLQGWQPGQPLEEIWTTDNDVPLQLREMARDVMRRRQARVERDARERASESASKSTLFEEHNSESEDDDVFEDAIDGRGNSLLEGVDLHFEWSPMETFQSVEEIFTPKRTGSVSSYSNPYDAFRSFWDDGILQVIVDETNRSASRINSAAFQADWYPINVHELLCLFAFWMMTGIIRMPTIASYFSTNSLLRTEVFSRITSRDRYNSLNRALHFLETSFKESANPTSSGAAASDPLHRLRPIVDHLNSKFQSNYVLSKDICIDESLTHWKGSLNFKQYIRSKAAQLGIKTFELCESATGYLWSFVVYTGKQDAVEHGIAKSTEIVLDLMRPLLNKGYRLFLDNRYNCPLLARILKRNGTDCVGTVCSSGKDVPRLVTQAPLQEGQLVARHSGDVCVLSWQDKRRVNMISTCHGSATGLSHVSSRPSFRPEPFKPQSVLDYNRSMGGVDRKDQMLEPYLLERKKCANWHLKLFKRLLNCSLHNSCVLLESSLKTKQQSLKFRLELVHDIISRHHPLIPMHRRVEASHSRGPFTQTVRHSHWPVRVPQTEHDRTKNCQSRRNCFVCRSEGRKTQKTPYMCEFCDVPLCVVNCFKKYHTSYL